MAGVKVGVGVDTTAFEAGLNRLAAQGNKFKANLERKFGLADVAKGFAQGLGIGSVGQVAELVKQFFAHAAESAKAMEESTSRALDATLKAIALRNSPERNISNLRGTAAGMDSSIGVQKKLVSDLDNNPLKWINADTMAMLVAAEAKLGEMQEKQSALLYQASELEQAEIRKGEELRRQKGQLQDNIEVQKKGMSELEAATRELARLQADVVNAKANHRGENAITEAENAVLKQVATVEGLKTAARQRLTDNFATSQGGGANIVADSLASRGGGGGVFTGGSPMFSEAQKQTALLAEIKLAIQDQKAGRLK